MAVKAAVGQLPRWPGVVCLRPGYKQVKRFKLTAKPSAVLSLQNTGGGHVGIKETSQPFHVGHGVWCSWLDSGG